MSNKDDNKNNERKEQIEEIKELYNNREIEK